MAFLPEDPRDQYRMLGAILIVALGAVYWLYIHRPKGEDLMDMRDRVAQIEHQNRLAESRMENLEAVRRELELAERQFAVLERLVPSREEVPDLYEAIASESQTVGLELVNVVPAEPRPDTTGHFMRQNWEMEVEGEYHDIGRFLARVAALDRIIRPEVSEIRPTRQLQGGRQLVGARFGLETFVLAPTEAGAQRSQQ
jgi:type IV pilus assembly protein PilO